MMLQSAVTYGRVIARAVVAGITSENNRFSTQVQKKAGHAADSVHLLTAASGFSKSYSPTQIQRKWGYGDDAYFMERHKTAHVLGVADGVGGWREYGVDPSIVPRTIMTLCARLVREGRFDATSPKGLLENAYEEVSMHKEPVMGSTTACILSLDTSSMLHTANLGDSGFMVVRNGQILTRSQEQTHYFNTPFQITLVPPSYHSRVIMDSPGDAASQSIQVAEGDIILIATDGLFDNMSDTMILNHLSVVKPKNKATIQTAADKIAHEARVLSQDASYMSPFAKTAAHQGYNVRGGKPDDITVLIATVNMGEFGEYV